MDNLKTRTPDLAEENFKKLVALFPNAVTETVGEDGQVVRAIDADISQSVSANNVSNASPLFNVYIILLLYHRLPRT